MKKTKLPEAAFVVIETDDKIILHVRGRDSTLGLPGGKVEEHETPKKAVKRETFEEYGVKLTENNLDYLGSVLHDGLSGELKVLHLFKYKVSDEELNNILKAIKEKGNEREIKEVVILDKNDVLKFRDRLHPGLLKQLEDLYFKEAPKNSSRKSWKLKM